MDEQHPRRATVGFETEVLAPERTRVALNWPSLVALVVVVAGAAATYVKLDSRVENSATKQDVERISRQIERLESLTIYQAVDSRLKTYFDDKKLLVNCPREVLRGKGDVICPAVPKP